MTPPPSASSSSGPWAIEAQGLAACYGWTTALDGIDLRVAWGERLSVFGPNGAGKTTLIRVLASLLRPSAGDLRIGGLRPWDHPSAVRSLLGVVAHTTYLYDELTTAENLRFYGSLYGVPDLEDRVGSLLEKVGLYGRRDERVGSLSRGMQQRLAIARAVLHDPPIMLLDEPETGLDLQAFQMLEGLLQSGSQGPRTVVLTTHNLDQGLRLGQRVVILARGRLAYQANAADLEPAHLREIYRRAVSAL